MSDVGPVEDVPGTTKPTRRSMLCTFGLGEESDIYPSTGWGDFFDGTIDGIFTVP